GALTRYRSPLSALAHNRRHNHLLAAQLGGSARLSPGQRRLPTVTDAAWRRGQRAWHRDPDTIPGYGVLVSLGERAGGEQCPQCGESDLQPYGNGSKWAEPEVDDDTVPVVGLLTQGRSHADRGARPDQPDDRGHLAAGRAAEADPSPAHVFAVAPGLRQQPI